MDNVQITTITISSIRKRSDGNYGVDGQEATVTASLHPGDDVLESIKTLQALVQDALNHHQPPTPRTPSDRSGNENPVPSRDIAIRQALRRGKCAEKPHGCGRLIREFRDEEARVFYRLNGVCQSCQDQRKKEG